MGIRHDPYLAHQFDRAVFTYGFRVDQLLEERRQVKKYRRGQPYYEYPRRYTLKQALRKAARDNSGSGGMNPYMLADLQRLEQAGDGPIDD